MQSPTLRSPKAAFSCYASFLLDTGSLDGWRGLVLDGAGGGAAGLDGLDHTLGGGVVVGDGAEDDVAAVEPGGHDGGDEELGAVAVEMGISCDDDDGVVESGVRR